MTTTNNRAWKALLPQNGMIGMRPQVGRVKIPPISVRQTLNLTGGRKIKAVKACWLEKDSARFVTLVPSTGRLRLEMDSLKGGETIEFVGHSREWHDMSGQNYFVVIVTDMDIIEPNISECRNRFNGANK